MKKNLNEIYKSLLSEELLAQRNLLGVALNEEGFLERVVDEDLLKFGCDFRSCGAVCCSEGERMLLINDVILLLENDLADNIRGCFPPSHLARELLENPQDIILYRDKFKLPTLQKKEGRCIFNQADYSCSAYPYRPTICKSFPFVLETKIDNGQTTIKVKANQLVECTKKTVGRKLSNFQLKEIVRECFNFSQSSRETLYLLTFKHRELQQAGLGKFI